MDRSNVVFSCASAFEFRFLRVDAVRLSNEGLLEKRISKTAPGRGNDASDRKSCLTNANQNYLPKTRLLITTALAHVVVISEDQEITPPSNASIPIGQTKNPSAAGFVETMDLDALLLKSEVQKVEGRVFELDQK